MKNRWRLSLAAACAVTIWLPAWPTDALLAAQNTYEWQGDKWTPAAKPAEGTAAGELAIVRQHFDDEHYGQAVKAAKKFKARYPDGNQYEEVCMLAGEAEMNRQRYWQAYGWFEKQLNQFPAGRYSQRALQDQTEIAEAFLGGTKRIFLGFIRLNATDEGLEILSRTAEHAPGTELAVKSLLRIADYHFAKRQWAEAADAYDAFLKLHAKSPQATYAMSQGATAAYYAYEGAEFDDTPLLDAEQRFKTLAESLPETADKAKVSQILDQLAAAQANRLYFTARFYQRTHKPPAAVFYYRQVVDKYPQTQWAKDAESQLARLGAAKVPLAGPAEPAGSNGEEAAPAAGADSPGAKGTDSLER